MIPGISPAAMSGRAVCANLPFPSAASQYACVADPIPYARPILPDPPPRIDSLDLLRGVAILGILLMNSQSMSLPSGTYYNPSEYGDYSGANRIVWILIHIIADTKFITTFSILFGAGILMQGQRVAARGLSSAGVHYRRMAILLLFGIIHAYALWYGDVLVPYALCGMLLFPIRRLPATWLMLAGALFVAMGTFMRFAIDYQLFQFATTLGDWTTKLVSSSNSGVEYELAAYRGGWWQQMGSRFWISLDNDSASFLTWTFWRCGGCMLIGMALQRARFFHAEWPRAVYAMLAALCIPIGWSVTVVGIVFNESHNWDVSLIWPFGGQFNYWGSLVAAIGYLSLGVLAAIMIASPATIFSDVLRLAAIPVRSVGKLALTNYIADTLIGTTVFYGHGFGKFGSFSRVELLQFTVTVWLIQMTLSTIYLHFFKQGPLEWLWHRLVYGPGRPIQPLRVTPVDVEATHAASHGP